MALIKYGPLAQEISGTVGGCTFARVAGAKVVRGWRAPCNKRTPWQMAQRQRLYEAATHWERDLTVEQRLLWDEYAGTCDFTNPLGEIYNLSGYQMFVRCRAVLQTIADPHVLAPTLPGFPDNIACTFELRHTSGDFLLMDAVPFPNDSVNCPFTFHTLRKITQQFPVRRPVATQIACSLNEFPNGLYTYPHPLPGVIGSVQALATYYVVDSYHRISPNKFALVPSVADP